MVAGETHEPRTTLEQARRRFESWRRRRASSRGVGSRIPEALWALAVAAAREHGLNPTAQFLHLDYNHLKKRLHAASGAARLKRPRAAFVELPTPSHHLSPCTIELENAHGAKLKIHLANPASVDWVALTRSFWDAAS
jgi:hypothetical protein